MRSIILCCGLFAIACGCNRKTDVATEVENTATFCEVHNLDLQPDVVAIHYGLIRPVKEEMDARAKLFPNARSSAHGGCCPDENKKSTIVRYCPECRKAETKWNRALDQQRELTKGMFKLREVLGDNPKFKDVSVFENTKDSMTLDIDGRVATQDDYNELRRIVAMNPLFKSVKWNVEVAVK